MLTWVNRTSAGASDTTVYDYAIGGVVESDEAVGGLYASFLSQYLDLYNKVW